MNDNIGNQKKIIKNTLIKLIFSKMNLVATGEYILGSISRTLHNFDTGFFSINSRTLEQ